MRLPLQNLLWGLGQPFAGAVADRFGLFRVMMRRRAALCRRPAADALFVERRFRSNIGAGVLIGFGLAGCSFNLVLSAFSKLLPPEKRGLALGAGTAGRLVRPVPVRAASASR